MKIDKKKKETRILTEEEKALRDKLYKLLESLPPEPEDSGEEVYQDDVNIDDMDPNLADYYTAIGEK